jgi:hypothetical protein
LKNLAETGANWRIENGAGRLGGLGQKTHVHDLIGHGLLDDHIVLRVDRDLDVVVWAAIARLSDL